MISTLTRLIRDLMTTDKFSMNSYQLSTYRQVLVVEMNNKDLVDVNYKNYKQVQFITPPRVLMKHLIDQTDSFFIMKVNIRDIF